MSYPSIWSKRFPEALTLSGSGARTHRGMTLQELATKVRILRSYLYLIEMRKRPGTREVLLKIAGALRVPPDNIIAWL
jgi:transcriptional regulator with XRE-family HTH domain